MNFILLLIALYLIVAKFLNRKKTTSTPSVYYDLNSPDWVKNAVLYQINVRQYSKKGNLEAVTNDLQRIKDLGVDIL
jgi:cyclomaltodextrinase / maltogenic alpha-amylase / neopullulanase